MHYPKKSDENRHLKSKKISIDHQELKSIFFFFWQNLFKRYWQMHFLFVSKCIIIPVKEPSFDVIVRQVKFWRHFQLMVTKCFKLKRKDEIVFSVNVNWQM